jgi:hypothetical protein
MAMFVTNDPLGESVGGFRFLRRQGIGFAEILIMLDTM